MGVYTVLQSLQKIAEELHGRCRTCASGSARDGTTVDREWDWTLHYKTVPGPLKQLTVSPVVYNLVCSKGNGTMPIRPRISLVMPWLSHRIRGLLACALCLLMTVLAIAASIAYGKNDQDACPPPFIFADHDQPDKHTRFTGHHKPDKHTRCILPRDATIDATVLIDTSQITLDCQGHTLRPAQPGVSDDPATAADETEYSSPIVAFVFNGAHSVTLQDCLVDGFDLGIYARNSKHSAGPTADRLGNKILSNSFHIRYLGICLLDVDDMQIIDNDITATSSSAGSILVWRDSDRNLIKSNRLVNNAESVTFGPNDACAPTPDAPRTLLDPAGGSIFVATGVSVQTLTTAIIDGTVYQNASTPTGGRPEDNMIEGNRYESARPSNIVYGQSEAIRTTFKDNTATGGAFLGIGSFGHVGALTFPGTCTLDSSRLCLSDGDCHLLSVDATSKGSCDEITSQDVNWPGEDTVIEGNDLRGPFTRSGIAVDLASGSHITGNIIEGPFGTGTNDAGITLRGKLPIETSSVTRNRVSGSGPALYLNHDGASFFGSTVSLNDFTGYTIAVRTNNRYDLDPTELSDSMQGNHWGLPCPGGFDLDLVQFLNGNINPFVRDNHPYGEPVAETPDSSLPSPYSE
jgi:Periplasmic copper-binding protein (NosD)